MTKYPSKMIKSGDRIYCIFPDHTCMCQPDLILTSPFMNKAIKSQELKYDRD